MSSPFKLRPGVHTDLPFITSSWVQSAARSSNLKRATYDQFQNKLVRNILNRSMTVVAVDPENPNQIFGWICFQLFEGRPVVHYTYVKSIYRGMGIGSELFRTCIKGPSYYYTHFTDKRFKQPEGGEFCPFLAFGEFYGEKGSGGSRSVTDRV